jgi:hypothetical protein
MIFDACAAAYLDAHRDSWRNAKHRDQWRNTLNSYASPYSVPCRCSRSMSR